MRTILIIGISLIVSVSQAQGLLSNRSTMFQTHFYEGEKEISSHEYKRLLKSNVYSNNKLKQAKLVGLLGVGLAGGAFGLYMSQVDNENPNDDVLLNVAFGGAVVGSLTCTIVSLSMQNRALEIYNEKQLSLSISSSGLSLAFKL